MKNALVKDFVREVIKTRSRFLSIMVLIALSVAFLSGLRATPLDMKRTGDSYLDAQNLADIQVLSNLGLTDGDLDALLALPEIESGEGAYVVDAFTSSPGGEEVTKAYSLTERDVNQVSLRSGRMPETATECVVDAGLLSMLDIELGDAVTVIPGGIYKGALRQEEYTVVGTIRSPVYITIERGSASIGTGTVKAYVYLPREAFSMDYYTAIYLRVKGAEEMLAFTEEYDSYIDGILKSMEPLAEERAALRHDELVDDADAQLESAQQELDAARAEAEAKLADAEAELAAARQQLDDGWAEWNAGQQRLDRERADAQRRIDEAEEQLERLQRLLPEDSAAYQRLREQYDRQQEEYERRRAQYEERLAEVENLNDQLTRGLRAIGVIGANDTVDLGKIANNALVRASKSLSSLVERLSGSNQLLNSARSSMDSAAKELSDLREQLGSAASALADYDGAAAQLEAAKRQLAAETANAEAELAAGRQELEAGEAEYADGVRQYEEGKREAEEQLAEAERELRAARRQVAEIARGEWYLFSRGYNTGYTGFGQDADRMVKLAAVFPMIFFLVAALVCLTTMTRMVEEQRIQIGSLKAMGYGRFAISAKYLGYGLLPSLVGSILGLCVGYSLFPSMIFVAYQIMYEVPNIELHSYVSISAFSILAAVACTTLSTLVACLATLREEPASLMRPRTPKAGKRVLLEYIKPLWRSLSFNNKVTARNLFRYQKRFWMTVIGISGCTALIIAGFGLRSSLLFMMSRQFNELFHFTAQLALSDTVLPEEQARLNEFLDSDPRIIDVTPCFLASSNTVGGGYSTAAFVEVMEADALPVSLELLDYKTGKTMHMSDEGVYIDQKLSELLDVRVGDEFFLDGEDRGNVRVAGIFEHYAAHFIYMTPAYYETAFGIEPRQNGYLLTLESEDAELCGEVFADLLAFEGVAAATRMADTRDTYTRSMERIDLVVIIVIVSALALAVVVLYNLSNINITERMRELATIKLLGFYDGEVSAYVYRENVVLTFLGIALGILLGHWLHMWLVRSVEIDLMMFGRDTDPMSYVYAGVLTALFSVIVNVLAHFKMKKIDMVTSLKSAE